MMIPTDACCSAIFAIPFQGAAGVKKGARARKAADYRHEVRLGKPEVGVRYLGGPQASDVGWRIGQVGPILALARRRIAQKTLFSAVGCGDIGMPAGFSGKGLWGDIVEGRSVRVAGTKGRE